MSARPHGICARPCRQRFALRAVHVRRIPAAEKGRATRIAALAEEERTMVFYESPYRVEKTLAQFAETFGADRRASVSREISKLHEETVRGTLKELTQYFAENEPRGEFVIVVEGLNRKNKNNETIK